MVGQIIESEVVEKTAGQNPHMLSKVDFHQDKGGIL